jgi:uncharacterized protein
MKGISVLIFYLMISWGNCFCYAQNNSPDLKNSFEFSDTLFANGVPLKKIYKLAGEGDPYFQCILSRMYRRGDFIKKNYKEAYYWAEKANQKGELLSYYCLARLYDEGYGVVRDTSKANSFYKIFTKSMFDSAYSKKGEYQAYIGTAYDVGIGEVKINKSEAISWYRLADKSGNDLAKLGIGFVYEYDSVKKNVDSAIVYYNLGIATNKNGVYYNNLATIFVQEKKDTVKALELYRSASIRKYAQASNSVAYLLYIRKDFENAKNWYIIAADQGDPEYQMRLGEFYENGNLVNRDYKQAMYWYSSAADQLNILAIYKLAWLYYTGESNEENQQNKAIELFKIAAEAGNKDAGYFLKIKGIPK